MTFFNLIGYLKLRFEWINYLSQLCAASSGGRFYYCLFSWKTHARHFVVCRLQSLAQSLAIYCYFVTFLPQLKFPIRNILYHTSVHSILHNIFVKWYTCVKIHACFNTSDYSMLVIGFCRVRPLRDCSSYFHKVYTLLLHPVSDALAANSKRWGENVNLFWKVPCYVVSQGGSRRYWQITITKLTVHWTSVVLHVHRISYLKKNPICSCVKELIFSLSTKCPRIVLFRFSSDGF